MHHTPDQTHAKEAHPQREMLVGYDWVGKTCLADWWEIRGLVRGGDGGMGEICRGAHKSLCKGSVADANFLMTAKLNIKRDQKRPGWATSLSDFSPCFVARPLFLKFFLFLWELFFSCHWGWQRFPHKSVGCRKLRTGWDREGREIQKEREAVSQGMRVWAPVRLHQYPGMPPLNPAKPAQSIKAVSRDTRTRNILICYENLHASCLGFSLASRILFATIILLRLICDNWPALHSGFDANG